jgi:hypothetical protein
MASDLGIHDAASSFQVPAVFTPTFWRGVGRVSIWFRIFYRHGYLSHVHEIIAGVAIQVGHLVLTGWGFSTNDIHVLRAPFSVPVIPTVHGTDEQVTKPTLN